MIYTLKKDKKHILFLIILISFLSCGKKTVNKNKTAAISPVKVSTPEVSQPENPVIKPVTKKITSSPKSDYDLIDDFNDLNSFNTFGENETPIKVSKGGPNEIVIKYDFSKGTFAGIRKEDRFSLKLKRSVIGFEVKTEGPNNNLEFKWIDMDGSVFGWRADNISYPDYKTIILSPKDFSYLWGGDKYMKKISAMELVVSKTSGGSGKVYIKNLRVIKDAPNGDKLPSEPVSFKDVSNINGKSLPNGEIIDDFSDINNWVLSSDNQTSVRINKGMKNEAVIEYSFSKGDWVSLKKEKNLPDLNNKPISFEFKTESKNNNLEIKLVDEDGSNFGWKKENANFPKYTKFTLAPDDFTYWWGGDNKLDKITAIDIAVSKNSDVRKGGKFYIKNLMVSSPSPASHDNTPSVPKSLDSGQYEKLTDWKIICDQNAILDIKDISRGEYVLYYSFNSGSWMIVNKSSDMPDDIKKSKISFYIKSLQPKNNIEVKLIDEDGSIFGWKQEKILYYGYKPIILRNSDFSYWWGGNDSLDKVTSMEIAISKGNGGTGKIFIKDFKISR